MLLPLFLLGSVVGNPWDHQAAAEDSNLITDPTTGIVYRKEFKTVERPVVETRMEQKVVTVSTPQTVNELEPVSQTYFTPVVRYGVEARWHGLWNPFKPATLAYHYVPQTQWEARTETYNRVKTSTRWVAEQRVVNEPTRVVRMEKQQEEQLVAVGVTNPSTSQTQVASLPPSAGLTTISTGPVTYVAPPVRTEIRGGMAPTVLDPYSTRVNVARSPGGTTFFR
ncbi:hypothetical protein [Candidatus Laterigemmans baculatus]|nr:hypothetical protein [Candidatus Laterigemmans baculatus]